MRALMSRGRRANPVLTYETALRRFFRIAPMGQSDGWWTMGEATAEERLYKSGIIIFGEQAVEFIQYIQMAVMLLLIHDI